MTLTPEQVWQSVLGQLQMEMPRASFDTWVRDTRALSYENGVLTIGARNAYARDWLESRLSSTVSRLLVGILNEQVGVRFVVMNEGEVEADEESSDDQNGGFTAEPVDATRYRDEVHPDHIVMLDAYCLRLMEQGDMTPKEMSLWVGFRQAVWRQWKIGQGTVRNIPHWKVMEFALMSRASYFRELSGKTALAGGHVELVPEPAIQSRNADRRMDNANRYRVRMAPCLTRHDCAVIEMILRAEVAAAQTPDESREAVLATLKDLAVRDVVDWINQAVEPGEGWPRSVSEIVQRVLGTGGDLPEDLQAACEKVFDRILGAFGKVSITHYFLRVVAPALQFSHPQAWAIIALRDRCWYDHESQTQKEFAIVRGGIEALAKWAGVTTKSVTGWLKDPAFSAFVRQADMTRLDVPDEWVSSGTAIFLVHLQEPLLAELLGDQAWKKRDSILEKMRLNSGKSETLFRKKRDSILEEMRLYLGKSETRLNSLIKPYLNHNKPHQTPTTRGRDALRNDRASDLAVAVDFHSWDMESIFRINRVYPKVRKELTDVEPGKLISWLLYAVSEEGRGIESPLSFALDRLSLTAGEGAGDRYDAFAALPPSKLIDLILGRAQDRRWDEIMGHESRRPRILLPILLGGAAPRERRTEERIVTKTYFRHSRSEKT